MTWDWKKNYFVFIAISAQLSVNVLPWKLYTQTLSQTQTHWDSYVRTRNSTTRAYEAGKNWAETSQASKTESETSRENKWKKRKKEKKPVNMVSLAWMSERTSPFVHRKDHWILDFTSFACSFDSIYIYIYALSLYLFCAPSKCAQTSISSQAIVRKTITKHYKAIPTHNQESLPQ